MASTEERIKEVVADTLGLPLQKITDDLTMEGTEEWDSLKHMELVAAIEECFAFELSFDEIVIMISISGIQKVVADKLNGDGNETE